MTKYHEITRYKSLNFNERNIAPCYNISRNTVSKICKNTKELNLARPLDISMTDVAIFHVEKRKKGLSLRQTFSIHYRLMILHITYKKL